MERLRDQMTQLQALLDVSLRAYDTCRLSASHRMYDNGHSKTWNKLDEL